MLTLTAIVLAGLLAPAPAALAGALRPRTRRLPLPTPQAYAELYADMERFGGEE